MTVLDERWMALEGLEIGGFTIRVGRYGNGRAALTMYGDDGIPHDRATVNLPELPLADNEFHVKTDAVVQTPKFFEALDVEGIAHPTPTWATSGRVKDYARVWRLGPRPANEAPC